MKNKLKPCPYGLVTIASLLFLLALILSSSVSPLIRCIILFSLFVTILMFSCSIMNKSSCDNVAACEKMNKIKRESDESKIRIRALENEITKVNAIDKIQKEKNQIQEELIRTTSYNQHLSGIIAGLNHELNPWISGIYILANRLQENETIGKKKESLKKIEMAAIHTSELLITLSKSINKVKNFSVFKSNVKDTVASWIQLVLLERGIKDKISQDNINVDLESLNFVAEHSPMYLSQIILNLAKNSIDHNTHMLDTLKIKIYGDVKTKQLIYEDNGKGIPPDILNKVFNNFGVTTKSCESGEIHGFGLYSCLNYSVAMNAIIVATSDLNKSTKFIIKFERIREKGDEESSTDVVYKKKE